MPEDTRVFCKFAVPFYLPHSCYRTMTYSLQRQLAWQIEAKYGGYGGINYCLVWLQYSEIGLREPYVIIRYDLSISLNTMLPTAETA
jgi:hypothetical protein